VPDDRHIFWVRDSLGGQGKSRMTAHLMRNHGAIRLAGRCADMAYLYKKERIAIFDISRAAVEHTDHLYSFAEELKNGSVVSTKYTSSVKQFEAPHVVFFSNSLPKEGKWSADRLILIDLDEPTEPEEQEQVVDGGAAATMMARTNALRYI